MDAMTQVVGVFPRISQAGFVQVLSGTAVGQEAGACWDVVQGERVDPLFALAIFWHESQFGTKGICAVYQTKSPGNTRSSSTGAGKLIQDPEQGGYVTYPSWTEGFRDLAHRLVDPRFPYAQAGATTIQAILPIWAPTSDGNSPTAYIQAVVSFMHQHQDQQEEPAMSDLIPISVQHVTVPAVNIPGYAMTPKFITIHETANLDRGANAQMHRDFVANGGGSEHVSFHYTVDDHQAIEIVPPNQVCWHAGDGADGLGNRTSIAIETCVNADGDWSKTKENLARLVVTLMRRHHIALGQVVQHYHWSKKDCPHQLRLSNGAQWSALEAHISALVKDGVMSSTRTFPETGKTILGGFRAFWEARGGLKLFGLPLTEEFDEGGRRVQYFERARFEWHPGQFPEDWDVQLGRVGAELLELKGQK